MKYTDILYISLFFLTVILTVRTVVLHGIKFFLQSVRTHDPRFKTINHSSQEKVRVLFSFYLGYEVQRINGNIVKSFSSSVCFFFLHTAAEITVGFCP